MSATDSTSVIPYGVCSSAAGARRLKASSVRCGTGAPAERTSRSAPSASRPSAERPSCEASTPSRAAGAAKRIVASTARTGIGESTGAERRGLRDVAVGHGDRDAERRPVERERGERRDEAIVGADPVALAHRRELGRHPPLVVEDALGRPGRARGEDDGGRRSRVGREALDDGGQPCLAALESRDLERAGRGHPAEQPSDAERLPGAEQPARLGAPQRPGEATEAEAAVDDDGDRTAHPARVGGGDEVDGLWREQRDAVAGDDAGAPQPLGDRGHTVGEVRETRAGARHRRRPPLHRPPPGRRAPTTAQRALLPGVSGPASARPGLEQPPDPRVGERGDVFLLDDQMPGERKAVQLGLRQPAAQVGGESEVEDGVALAPGEQDRHLELRKPRGHTARAA